MRKITLQVLLDQSSVRKCFLSDEVSSIGLTGDFERKKVWFSVWFHLIRLIALMLAALLCSLYKTT
jgi:hypothetical protein